MISDRAFADLCAASYDPASASFAWDERIDVAGVKVFIKRFPDLDAVIFPGTEDVPGWLKDFFAIPLGGHQTIDHADLGPLHAGFAMGVPESTDAIRKVLRPDVPFGVGAHSLGAPRGWISIGLMLGERQPARVCMFASPHPGFPRLAQVINDRKLSAISYWNLISPVEFDVVPTLAPPIPPLFPWTSPGLPAKIISVPPIAGDRGVFPLHRIAYYRAGAAS